MQAQRKLPDSLMGEAHAADSLVPPMPPPPFATDQAGLELPAIASPAHELQAQLQSAFEAPMDEQERWPYRNTLALLIFSCSVFWGGVIWGLTQLFA